MRLFKNDPLFITDKLLEFSRQINLTGDKEKVIECLVNLFFDNRNKTLIGSIGILSKKLNDSKHLAVFIKGIDDPQKETESSHKYFKQALEAKNCKVDIIGLTSAKEQNLFHLKASTSALIPILSGTKSYGLLKIDLLLPIESLKQEDEAIVISAIQQLANRLEDLVFSQLLIERNAERFFDKTLLALRSNESEQVLPVLHDQLKELKNSTPSSLLPVKWQFYYSEHKTLKYQTSDQLTNNPEPELYYIEKSHIWHFIDSNQESHIYTIEGLKSLNLKAFNGRPQTSLCVRTDLSVNEVPKWGRSDAIIYVVLWTEYTGLFERYLTCYKTLIKELVQHIKNNPRISLTSDDASNKRMGDISNQLFGKKSARALQNFLVAQAKSLLPGVDMASYGEVSTESGTPLINMRAVTDGCLDAYNKYPQPIKNEGLWQRLWETQGSINVNNNYEKIRIIISPIESPNSAIAIPIFKDDNIHSILSLCSSQENFFSPETINLLEWLVQIFSAKLREIGKSSSTEQSSSEESREIQAIRSLIDLFATDETEHTTTTENVESLVKKAIRAIVPYTECSCWGLFDGDDNKYTLLAHNSLTNDTATLNKLEFTLVADILREEIDELLVGSLRKDNRFTKLLPLLPFTTNSCLALPIHIKKYQSIDRADTDKPRSETHLLTLFLFHYHENKFSYTDLEFLKVTVSLLEALMRQYAFQQEIERITPLVFSGEVAASIAHEIKNPCQPLLSFINIMNNAWQKNHWHQQAFTADMPQRIKDAHKALKQINENVIKLITLSDITHLTLEHVSIAKVLNSVLDYQWYGETMTIEQSSIKIILDELPLNLPIIHYDKAHLSTLLTNLIKNAVQAIEGSSKKRGEIHIGVRLHSLNNQKVNRAINHRAAQQSQTEDIQLSTEHPLEIYIRDDGPGIAAETKHRMFLAFETTKIKGTGLGCYICKRMMKKIDSEIKVDSTLGQGATLRLLFNKKHLIY